MNKLKPDAMVKKNLENVSICLVEELELVRNLEIGKETESSSEKIIVKKGKTFKSFDQLIHQAKLEDKNTFIFDSEDMTELEIQQIVDSQIDNAGFLVYIRKIEDIKKVNNFLLFYERYFILEEDHTLSDDELESVMNNDSVHYVLCLKKEVSDEKNSKEYVENGMY